MNKHKYTSRDDEFPLDAYIAVHRWIGNWAEEARDREQRRIAQAAYDSLTAVGILMRDNMRKIREQNDGGKVKKKRAKATTRAPESQDPIDNPATQDPAGEGSSERPTKEELLEWAATQKGFTKTANYLTHL